MSPRSSKRTFWPKRLRPRNGWLSVSERVLEWMYWFFGIWWTIIGAIDLHAVIVSSHPHVFTAILALVQTFGGVMYALWLSKRWRLQRQWRTRVDGLQKTNDALRASNDKWLDVIETFHVGGPDEANRKLLVELRQALAEHPPMLEEDQEVNQ